MRFSIVFDDNGTVLAASVAGEEIDNSMTGTGLSRGYFDVAEDSAVELNHTVERMLVDLDARKLMQSPRQGEGDDSEFE